MKVLHILHSFPPAFRIGGPALSVSSLITELERQNLTQNTVYATNLDLNTFLNVSLKKEIIFNNFVVIFFPIFQFKISKVFSKFNSWFKRWYLSFSLIKYVIKNIKTFDIVHIHMPFIASSFATALVCIVFKVPYLISYRGCLDPQRIKQNSIVKMIYINIFERFLFKFSSSAHALTFNEAEIINSYFSSKKIKVLPNGINLRKNKLFHEKDNFNNQINILFLSRIERIKGALFLAENFKKYLKSKTPYRSINIDFVGPLENKFGEYNNKFLKLLSNSNCMNFYGPKTGIEKEEFLRKAHFLILPSFGEGLPMTVLEALSFGIPVIITHQCNIPEIKEYNAGYIFNPSYEDLANCLNQIQNLNLKQYEELSRNAFKLCSNKFNIVNLARKYHDFYQKFI